MNFFGHTVLAVRRSTDPAFVLGSMLPDFATMIQARPPDTEHADIESGMQFHWRTDEETTGPVRKPAPRPAVSDSDDDAPPPRKA
ncbi:MAG: hypothetical protein ACRELZ_21460, partial [Candidatus Rokuibacteriota bacterium]